MLLADFLIRTRLVRFSSTCLQDLAQGKSLADLIKGGWHADEDEVTRIAKELLSILDYLAKRRPAVTHRCCIKPM